MSRVSCVRTKKLMTVCSKVNFHYPLAECGCAYDVYLSLNVQHQRVSYLAYIYHYIFYTPRMQKVKALCNQMAFAKRLHKSFTVIATVQQKKCKCLRLQLNLIPVIIKARHSICMKCFACLDGESGGFQLLDLTLLELKSHVIPYKFKSSHWLNLQHSDWRVIFHQ